jgi:large subunit ribosomal protein L10
MDRNQKAAVIDEVAGQISGSEAVYAVDYRGISVTQVADLRTRLRDSDTSFRVVKNTLTERAADQAGATELKPFLEGPTAIAFVRGDAAQAAKALSDFGRTTGTLAFKGGLLNGAPLSIEQITDISRLPSREVLVGRLVGMVAAPLTGLVTGLGGLIGGLARQLQAVADQGLIGTQSTSPVGTGGNSPASASAPAAVAEPEAPAEPAEEAPEPDPAPAE